MVDMNKNPISVIKSTSALAEDACHIVDGTKPVLEAFDFDFDSFVITLTFSETVEIFFAVGPDADYTLHQRG
jgi:hypothetical protein